MIEYGFQENVDFTTIWNGTKTGDVVEQNGKFRCDYVYWITIWGTQNYVDLFIENLTTQFSVVKNMGVAEKSASGRELHEVLEIGRDFTTINIFVQRENSNLLKKEKVQGNATEFTDL